MVCKKCGNPLSGKQKSFCSIRCSRNYLKADYKKRNREKINNYNRIYRKNKKPYLPSQVKFDECYFCGSKDSLQNHHASYKPEVIVRLCKVCHKKIHLILPIYAKDSSTKNQLKNVEFLL